MDALPPLVAQHLDQVRALCEKYHVRKLTMFGSAVKGTFDPERSDLDFVVDFEWDADPIVRGRRWLGLWDELRALFGREVDLVVASTLTENPYLEESIRRAHVALYDAA